MNNTLKVSLLGLVILLIGVGIGRYMSPTKTIEVTKETESVDTSKEIVDTEKKNADGSTEKTRVVREIKKEIMTNETQKLVESVKPDWRVSGLVGYSLKDLEPVYGVDVQRRILGSVSVGVFANTQQVVGVSVGYEF